MKNILSDSLLSRLSDCIAARTALHFPPERWNDLGQRVKLTAKEFGFTDEEAFIQWLTTAPLTREQTEMLSSYLTINETHFWREPKVFSALEEQILPELIHAREKNGRMLRIWSAGCSSGEEPYSIAIALRRVIPDLKKWNITILATDINPIILRKAKAGVYGEWSFRNVPSWFKGSYFHCREDGKFEFLPEIQSMVTFAYLNLAEDIYPSLLNNTNAMDIIFCRNVLMYFAPERAKSIVQNLYHSLASNGWLIVGSSELSQYNFPQFATVNFPEAIVYRKETRKSRLSKALRFENAFPQEILLPLQPVAEIGESALPIQFLESASPGIVASLLTGQTGDKENLAVEKHGKETPCATTFSIRALANQGRLADALILCDQAIAADKLDAGLQFLRATIFQEQNKEDEAISSLKHALYLNPDFVLAHFTLGNLALRQGNARAAKKCFRNVLSLLDAYQQEDILPESGDLTAGRFREITHATIKLGAPI